MTKEEFLQLPANKRKVVIAQDILDQIDKEIYKPKRQLYINTRNLLPADAWESDVQETLEQGKIKNCEVCAVGATLLSATKILNELKWIDLGGTVDSIHKSAVRKIFLEVFTPKETAFIEAAFEGYSFNKDRLVNNNLMTSDWFAADVLGETMFEKETALLSEDEKAHALSFFEKYIPNKSDFQNEYFALEFEQSGFAKEILIDICNYIINNNGHIFPQTEPA